MTHPHERVTRVGVICPRCGAPFSPTARNQKYCCECRTIPSAAHRRAVKKWRLSHPEYCKIYRVEYAKANPDKRAIINKRAKAKRRSLSFAPMNNFFNGCEAHHINKHDVIYIPKELHRSIYHNIWTGQGMERINTIAFSYLNDS